VTIGSSRAPILYGALPCVVDLLLSGTDSMNFTAARSSTLRSLLSEHNSLIALVVPNQILSMGARIPSHSLVRIKGAS
jgi:hypothetical protein